MSKEPASADSQINFIVTKFCYIQVFKSHMKLLCYPHSCSLQSRGCLLPLSFIFLGLVSQVQVQFNNL
jgi:hypothetical protein